MLRLRRSGERTDSGRSPRLATRTRGPRVRCAYGTADLEPRPEWVVDPCRPNAGSGFARLELLDAPVLEGGWSGIPPPARALAVSSIRDRSLDRPKIEAERVDAGSKGGAAAEGVDPSDERVVSEIMA